MEDEFKNLSGFVEKGIDYRYIINLFPCGKCSEVCKPGAIIGEKKRHIFPDTFFRDKTGDDKVQNALRFVSRAIEVIKKREEELAAKE
jgi:ferredoxin